ncbi:hypothetical protein FOCC_FOCC008191 [Frankliniella occidentalis]|nr:hypothetical protein FOCC_FOCC008191 [Frankliniella occidentalis]
MAPTAAATPALRDATFVVTSGEVVVSVPKVTTEDSTIGVDEVLVTSTSAATHEVAAAFDDTSAKDDTVAAAKDAIASAVGVGFGETEDAVKWRQHKVREAERKRKSRAARKGEIAPESSPEVIANPYRSKQTLRKAMTKCRKALPSSPSKRKTVVEHLAKKEGFHIVKPSGVPLPLEEPDDGTRRIVQQFYRRDDVSGQSPNCKDRVIIRKKDSKGKLIDKQHIVKRYLTMSIGEAFQLFLREHSEIQISKARFYNFRPAEIVTFKNIPENVCLCKVHENIRYLVDALHPHVGVPRLTNGSDEFLSEAFLTHVYVKRQQCTFFKSLKENVDGSQIVLQIDFAENFTITNQNGIQSAHWNHERCTLFTAHSWISPVEEQAMVIVSDDLQHDKVAVYKFLDLLLDSLTSEHDSVKEVHIISDGAASQFKQKFTLSTMNVFEQKYGIILKWHFSASGHGKGVIDGHGATVRGATSRRLSSGLLIKGAEGVASLASKICPNILISFVSSAEVRENESALQEHWEGLKAIPKILRMHYFESIGPYAIVCKEESNCNESNVYSMKD